MTVRGGGRVEGPPVAHTEGLLPGVCQHRGEGPAAPVDPGVCRLDDRVKVLASAEKKGAGEVGGAPALCRHRHGGKRLRTGKPGGEHLGGGQQVRGGGAANDQDVVSGSVLPTHLVVIRKYHLLQNQTLPQGWDGRDH